MKQRLIHILLASSLLALLPAGCSKPTEKNGKPAGTGAMQTAPAHGAAPAAQDLKFTAPPEWTAETPASPLRKAQYRLARAEGDPEDAELNVFYFPGEGGSVQANIDRWIGQFQQPDGSPATGAISRRQSHGVPLTIVDVTGIYMAGGAMMTESKPKPNFRMLAAVAEASAGPWFFKLTGPAKTIARWEASFQSFLDTIQAPIP